MKPSKVKLLFKYKYFMYIFIFTIVTTICIFFLYPKTELTMAVSRQAYEKLDLDENGKIRSRGEQNLHLDITKSYYVFQQKLEQQGLKLKFIAQDSIEVQKNPLEFLISNPSQIDIVVANNYGGTALERDSKKALSIGSLGVSPFFILEKANTKGIKTLKDLKGKKIGFWTSPEGKKNPSFTVNGDKPSEYSSDIFYENLFKIAGITPTNTKLINFYPNKISENDDWDILLGIIPIKKGSRHVDKDIYEALIQNKIRFTEFEDIDAIYKNLPNTKILNIHESIFDIENNLPNKSYISLGITRSAFVNSKLDPSLIIILCEVLKDMYGTQGKFSAKDEYPNFSSVEMFKPSAVAEKFYHEGENFIFRKYFPPIFAAFIEKLLFVLAPIFFIAIPLYTFLPGTLKKYFERKINEYYEEIYELEKFIANIDATEHNSIKTRLDLLDEKVRSTKFPFLHDEFVQQIFIVREHIALIQKKLARINNELVTNRQ
jgi:hypothetical protein